MNPFDGLFDAIDEIERYIELWLPVKPAFES